MIQRYLLLAKRDAFAPEMLGQIAERTGFRLAYSDGHIAAFVNQACLCLPLGHEGFIIGTLFHRHGAAQALSAIPPDDCASAVRSCGQSLLRSFWGGYVALVAGPASLKILRDPSGALPCFFARARGLTLIASDATLLVQSGLLDVAIDFDELGRHLYRAGILVPQTVLAPIRELMPGFSLDIFSEAADQEMCWSPWDHVADLAHAPGELAEQLHRIVQHSIAACVSGHKRLLLSVSGGLDSSIVAASLAKAGTDALCLTMFTDDAAGDERIYARALCEQLKLPLLECRYALGDIDIDVPLAVHMPRPRDRAQAIAYERTHRAVAAETGADAFVTGNGGDSVFAYSQSAAPIADRFLHQGLRPDLVATLLDVCRQTGCSIHDAVASAWRLANGSPAYVSQPNRLFLHADVIAQLDGEDLTHPWLEAPRDALPGKAAHIAWILRIQHSLEASRDLDMPVINPLMAQPIVEACLGIQSWHWRAGGRDRAVARHAFSHDLPPLIVNRRVKGSPSGFASRLLDHFRGAIRERLLNGRLARNRIIAVDQVEQALSGVRPIGDLERVRILELVNIEAWIQHWANHREALEPAKTDINAGSHRCSPS